MSGNLPEKNRNWKTWPGSGDGCLQWIMFPVKCVNLDGQFCRHLFPFLEITTLPKVPLVLD